jgi:hypothetical protein
MRGRAAAIVTVTALAGGCATAPPPKPDSWTAGVRYCRVVIGELAIADGTCEMFAARDGSSFQIRDITRRDAGNPYFVVLTLDQAGRATGIWNGRQRTWVARDELGQLIRAGDCWSNAKASVCAWD